ncbi:MAG: M16 family metallopeptidase [Acidimicrobiia bacterium]|jgi:predicted Zn-dependent peptidase
MTAPDPGVEQTELPNGLRIVTETMPEARSVSLGAWVRVGGRDEPAALSGASHFLEHLLFKGTEERSARQIAEAIDAVGGEMNAFTSREHTAYYARLPHAHVALGVEILGDVLTSPALRPAEVEAERQVIVEEILMNLDAPDDRVHTLLAESLFPGHPLGRDVLGDRESVEAITREDIAGFFGDWYRPATMVVAAAGRLDHDAVVESVAGAFGDRRGGSRPFREAPGPLEPTTVLEHDDTEQSNLCLGWRCLPVDHEDRWTLAVANQILGGGMASRLFQEVREARGLAYAVYSHASGYADSGYLSIYCGTAPSRAAEALTVIDGVVEDLLAGGVTEREREVAVGYLEGSMLLGLEDTGGRMGRLGRSLVQRDAITTVDEHVARLRAVTVDDVSRVLHDVLAGPRVLAGVGPFEGGFPAG